MMRPSVSGYGLRAQWHAAAMVLAFAGWSAACAHPVVTTEAPTAAFDRTHQPVLGPPPALVMPAVLRRELPNGLQIVEVERHNLPVADFILLVRTGPESDPAGKPGLSSLTADLLTRGTATRSATAIAEQEALLGVSLRISSTWDQTTIALHTPIAELDSALALFADVALHPAFAPAEVDRAKQDRVTRLIELSDRGPFVAGRAFDAILYGSGQPYGRPPLGTETSIAGMTPGDLRAFYAAAFQPRNAVLIVAGDVKPGDVERRAHALFGGWAPQGSPAGTAAPGGASGGASAGASPPATIYLINKADAAQSSIRIGSVGVARSTPDYFPLLVLNTALGGAFTSRLNQNLRETHGYTYGAFSDFDMRRDPGPFIAEAEVVSAKTDSSLLEFMRELRAIHDTMPAAELSKTKRYLQLELPGDFETTSDIASELIPVVLYGLPDDFYTTYQLRVGAVTQAEVQRVAQRYIDPGKLTIVVVGDRRSIESPLRATGIGAIVPRGPSGEAIQP
jgi:predicted Zn-dependent peptidase